MPIKQVKLSLQEKTNLSDSIIEIRIELVNNTFVLYNLQITKQSSGYEHKNESFGNTIVLVRPLRKYKDMKEMQIQYSNFPLVRPYSSNFLDLLRYMQSIPKRHKAFKKKKTRG